MLKYGLDRTRVLEKNAKESERERSMRAHGFKPVFQIDPRSSTYKLDGILGMKPALTRKTLVKIKRNPLIWNRR